jgi:hypothetical protein
MGKLVYQPLDKVDKTFLREVGSDLDLTYNFLPNTERRELNKRDFGKEYLSSEFNFEIPKKNKSIPADKRGFQLQVDAKMIANQAVQVQRAVLARDTELAHMYIRNIVLKTTKINTNIQNINKNLALKMPVQHLQRADTTI